MKNINEYFDYLYSLERTGMKYSLDNITRLLKALGNPHKALRFLHIAGTNGKGATASFAASILTECGLKTGLFTSPHILRFNERIRVDGKCISNSYIKSFLNSQIRLIKLVKPSFFEVNTALAFKYFYDKKVDAAVVEAGLGGRLDSTNIIRPEVSVITQIGMDHMQFLGKTLYKIASEKLGIVKPGVDVIVSDDNKSLKRLFNRKIEKKYQLRIDKYAKTGGVKQSRGMLSFNLSLGEQKKIRISTPLPGVYQTRNAAAGFLAATKFLTFVPPTEVIRCAAQNVKKNTGYFGRIETIHYRNRKFILDVSHNPDGVSTTLKELKNANPRTVIFGMMSDKDYKSAVNILIKQRGNIIFTRPEYKRALDSEVLLNYAVKNMNRKAELIASVDNVKDSLEMALKLTPKGKEILVIGSFFLVSDILKTMGRRSLPF